MESEGIFAETLGKLHMTEKSWHVVTYIDLQNVDDNFALAQNMFEKFINICRNEGYVTTLENERILLLTRKFSELNEQKLEIFKMLQSNNKVRRKRALGPLVYIGKAYKYSFGLLNEEDKKIFDEKIAILEKLDEETLSLSENQTRIVKNKFLMCEENFKHYKNLIREHEISTNNATLTARKIMFYEVILHRYVTDLEIDCSALINAITFANEGQIHPKLISHDNVVNLTRIIQLFYSIYLFIKNFLRTPCLGLKSIQKCSIN